MANIPIVNPGDAEWKDTLFELQFGAYGSTRLYVWADHLEDAFEEAVEWLDENAPGHLINLTTADLKEAAKDEGITWQSHWPDWGDPDFEKVIERAEADLTLIGHTTLKHGQYVASWEWTGHEVDHAKTEKVREASLALNED
jgi:hypothetical protein